MNAETEKISRRIDKAAPIPEIDIGVAEWFALPKHVRKKNEAHGLHMQLTTGCSCACWYCRVVDASQKGGIYSMIPLSSVKKVIKSAGTSGYSQRSDSYYRASDPFDYSHYLAVIQTAIAEGRRVYTSTTVPKGAEGIIREVLDTLAQLDDYQRSLYPFRFSVNGSHRHSAAPLIQYAQDLEVCVVKEDRIKKTELAVDPVLSSGEVAELSLIGITRSESDGLVISPHGVTTSISMPMCQAAPAGILTIPTSLEGKVFPETYISVRDSKDWYFTGPFAYMDGSEHLSSLPSIGLAGEDAVLRFINGARRLQDSLLTYNLNFGFTNDKSMLLEYERSRLEREALFHHGVFIKFAQGFLELPEELMSDSVLRAFLEPLFEVIHEVARIHAITIPRSTGTHS